MIKSIVSKRQRPDGSWQRTMKFEGPPVVPAKVKERVGTHLRKIIDGFVRIKATRACKCKTLAAEMDQWGVEGCQLHRETIVNHLVGNRDILVESLKANGSLLSGLAGFAAEFSPDWVLRKGAEILLDTAIANAKADQPQVRVRPAPRRGFGSAFRYTKGEEIRFIRSAQFAEDIKLLIGKIPPDVTAIAGVARSGLAAATMLSMYLHLPMLTIRQTLNDVIPTGNGWRLGGSRHIDPRTEKILIVDDTCMTGNSLKAIRPLVENQFGNAITATVYCNPLALVKPDIHAVDLGWPHLLEWNLFNSILSPSMAVDFDGVLCRDCEPWQDDDGDKYREWMANAVPLYVPRRTPIPLIVTARIEKYRDITEEWLRRHGIQWRRLVMHPAKTLRERMRDDIPAYKSRHYAEWAKTHMPVPGPVVFVESDDWQARRIGQLSRKLCICPHTGGVYK